MSDDTIHIKSGERAKILDAMQNSESLSDQEIIDNLVFEGWSERNVKHLLKTFRNPDLLHSSKEIDFNIFDTN